MLPLVALHAASLCLAPAPTQVIDADGALALDNGLCRIELDARTGAIRALTPGPVSLRGPWFEIVVEDRNGMEPWETWLRGSETTFAGGPAQVTVARDAQGDTARLRCVWELPSGLRAIGEVELGPGDAGPRFRVEVINETQQALVDTIHMPVLSGIELGDGADDWFTWPHTLGTRFRVQGFDPGETLAMPYPEFLYMQWLDLFDERQGVYMGCLDDYGYSKELFIGRDPAGASRMGIAFTGCWIAKRGDRWATPWVQIAAHEGDWRAGADLYRPFAQAAFGPLDPPERVRDMPTAQCWLAHHASDGDIGKLFEIQQQGPIHSSYLMKSLNTSTPEGWDGFRGSGLELEAAFSRIRELGGSPALFTIDRAPFLGKPHDAAHAGVLQRRDQSIAEAFRDMMPSPFDPDLVRARVAEARRWVQAFGLDEIHFDTAATTGPAMAGPSYTPGFTQRPNEVPHYFKALYRAIRDACREANAEFILRAEHCADFFYPEFLTSTAHFFEGGNLVARHNAPTDARLLPELFRYTLPRHAALQMPSMSESDFWTYGYGMGHGFHGGGPSWCFNPGTRQAESPPGEVLHRYRFYDADWRRYYDFRVGFEEAVVDADWSDTVAEARIDGTWRRCDYPGPVVAVTHSGGGREVTLGQWYPLSHSSNFAEKFLPQERPAPGPVRLRVPTRLGSPHVRLFDAVGEVETDAVVGDGMVEVTVPDPSTFALEVAEGPTVRLDLPELAHPGQTVRMAIHVDPGPSSTGTLSFSLPAGWPEVKPIAVAARKTLNTEVALAVPAGIFGRNYPIKAVLRAGELKRSVAAHLKVMEPLTVLYGFDTMGEAGPLGVHALDPGHRGRLTITCANNTAEAGEIEIRVSGEQISGSAGGHVDGVTPKELGDTSSALGRWADGGPELPPNALVRTFDFDCTGVPAAPAHITVSMGGRTLFEADATPRTRVMDLNGPWQVRLIRRSTVEVGGDELNDNLDIEATTPSAWDGDWPAMATPIRLDEDTRKAHSWAIYRRLVFLPPEWRGADLQLRLGYTGGPWGAGGTLNLIYVNGWPAGRIGSGEECSITPFLVVGGWNLIAVASMSPNSLIEPYLFVRDVPAPERVRPQTAAERPEGAFIVMGERPTGQGLTLPFIKGVVEGDHRRTDVASGGENVFIYVAIADAFVREPAEPVEILVEYLDEGTAPFGLAYDSTDATAPISGAFKDAPECRRTDSGEWRTRVFRLDDARLANRQHMGADFRVFAQGDDLHVRRIEVRKAPG